MRRPPPARSNRRAIAAHSALIGGLLLISVVMWWRVWILGHPTSTVVCQCGDVSESLGYLAWTPWALVNGHNLFLSNAIYAGQGGANMLINTSWIAGSLLFAPITWLFGPIATFNVVGTLAPVVSGWCFFLAARKVTRFVPGQMIASTLYGFSPILVAGDRLGHFWQSWLIFPPLAFLFLYDLFVTQRHRPAILGVGLGLLTVVQFFNSTEMLAVSALVGLIGIACAGFLSPRPAWIRRRHIGVGLIAAAGTSIVFLAYPVWFALYGPRHIVGYAWPGVLSSGNPVSGPVSAGPYVHQHSPLTVVGGYFGNAGPNPSYLGVALVAFLILSAFVWFRSRLGWVVVVMGVSSWLFSLGTAQAWMPWRVFEHIPVVSQIAPATFSAMTTFAAALLLALSADGWWSLIERHLAHRSLHLPGLGARGLHQVSGALLAIVTAATLIPVAVTYTLPFVIHNEPMPPWFRHFAPRLPPQTVVLTFPYPNARTMGWQAVDGMGFRIVGGFAIVPGNDGRHSEGLSPFEGSIAVLESLAGARFGITSPIDDRHPPPDLEIAASLGRSGCGHPGDKRGA